MDAYRKGLNAQQTAFAMKQYKSHRRVGLPSDIIRLMAAKEALKEASKAA